MHELRGAPEPRLPELLARMAPVDLVLVEGFKHARHPKLEVFRPAVGKPPLWPGDDAVVAVASDRPLPDCPHPVLDRYYRNALRKEAGREGLLQIGRAHV